MKRIITLIGIILLAMLLTILTRTILFKSKQPVAIEAAKAVVLDKNTITEHLSQALRYKTISYDKTSSSADELLALHGFLEKCYPYIHKKLKKEVIGGYSLFYTWQGKEPELRPILFSGHLDVVPAEQSGGGKWTHPPFVGFVDSKYIWGRGALDNKGSVISILEAVEQLIKEGYEPERTICLVFTHDEEVGGLEGASKAAEIFEARGIRFQYVLDEGGTITSGMLPGVEKQAAMIGTAEKGAVNIELSVTQPGGTSAVPPKESAIGILSKAICKLEQQQFPMRLDGAARQMLEYIGPEMGLVNRSVLANLWIFDGLVKNNLSKSQTAAALLKTTTAVTILNGGNKANVMPSEARANVNFRIIQGDSVEGVIRHVEQGIDDGRVKIRVAGYTAEPSPVSDTGSADFSNISRTIKQIFPDVLVTPYLWTGGTNSKYFVKYADNIYRFSPLFIDTSNAGSIHGTDERISIDNLLECVRFYRQLIVNSAR